MDNKKMVVNWLENCDKQGILPWEYDFKKEVFIQKSWSPCFNEDPVKRILEKDSGFYGNPSCETEDSMLMQAIYQILWKRYSKNVIREEKGDCDADVMNSFWIIFRNFTSSIFEDFFESAYKIYPRGSFPNKGIFSKEDEKSRKLLHEYNKYGIKDGESWVTLILKNYDDVFQSLNNTDLQKLAMFSHTIGNFTLTPKGFNFSGTSEKNLKHNDGNNTWSEALLNLKELDWEINNYLGCNSWNEYCKEFYMDDYEKEYAYVTTEEDQNKFLQKINTAIEHRGKLMTKKLCEELGLIHLNFYKDKKLEDLNRAQWLTSNK